MSTAFDRCVAAEHARWRRWKKVYGPASCPSIAPAEWTCQFRQERGELAATPRYQLSPTMVGVSAGGLAFVVGTFLGAAVAPNQSLGWGAFYALFPSIAAGIIMGKLYREQPHVAANIYRTATGMPLPVATPKVP